MAGFQIKIELFGYFPSNYFIYIFQDGVNFNQHGIIIPFFRHYQATPDKRTKVVVEHFIRNYFSNFDAKKGFKSIAPFYEEQATLTIATDFTGKKFIKYLLFTLRLCFLLYIIIIRPNSFNLQLVNYIRSVLLKIHNETALLLDSYKCRNVDNSFIKYFISNEKNKDCFIFKTTRSAIIALNYFRRNNETSCRPERALETVLMKCPNLSWYMPNSAFLQYPVP